MDGAYEIESVLGSEGTKRFEAVVITNENYFLIPNPEISNETGEYQASLSFPYRGYTISIVVRDLFVTTPQQVGLRFDERYVNLSSFYARLQRMRFVPESNVVVEFVSPEYFRRELSDDRDLVPIEIAVEPDGGHNIEEYDNRVKDGEVRLYVVIYENSELVNMVVKEKKVFPHCLLIFL